MKTILHIAMIFLFLPGLVFSADWPMWRCDAERSGASAEGLPEELILLWSRKLPPVCPAWPSEQDPQREGRLGFDASYEPIVMGKLVMIGSPNEGSVTAFDTETGEERWTFFAEGPVRCAPAGWKDRIFVASDDGSLYSLRARDGKQLWKFRGAPADRPDRRQLGNGQLISFWPARGGPVVVNDTVYFGCGVWSIYGIFLYALDAETGEIRWENHRLDHIANVRNHHEHFSNDGLSPQGHLAAVRDRLLVPSGRSLPAGLELDTGRLVYWVRGFHHGDCRVAAHGEYAFVGKEAVVNTYDFREVGSRWAYTGSEGPEGYRPWGQNHVGNPDKADMGEALWAPYKFVKACDVDSAFHDGLAYGVSDGTFFTYDLTRARNLDQEQVFRREVTIWAWEPPLLWSLETGHTGPGSPVIRAGNRIYGAIGNTLLAVDHLRKQPAVAWEKEIEGRPTSLIAADGKLIVATAEGWIHSYGRSSEDPTARVFDARSAEPGAEEVYSETDALLSATDVHAGYGLVLGLEDGHLVEGLLKRTELYLIAVDEDASKIDALRRRYARSGVLGDRLQFLTGDPLAFPFPPYMASLIVSEWPAGSGFPVEADARTLLNVLRPYGGVLCLKTPPNTEPVLETWAAPFAQQVTHRPGSGFSMLVREHGLPGSTPWTHDTADAARTYCSRDDRVRAPLGVLWYGDVEGANGAGRYGKDRAMVNRGQVFMNLSSSLPRIMSYDAYTGRFLWSRQVASKTRGFGVAAMEDGVYVAADGRCAILGLEDGAELKSYPFAPGASVSVKEIRVDQDFVLIAFDAEPISGAIGDDVSTLACLDRKSGAVLWRREAQFRFNIHSVVLGDGLAFCVDAFPVVSAATKEVRRGKWSDLAGQKEREVTVRALDGRTGREVWAKTVGYENENELDAERKRFAAVGDWLAYSAETGTVIGGRVDLVHGWDARTGRTLWENRPGGNRPTILRDGHFITCFGYPVFRRESKEFDLATATPTERFIAGDLVGCNHYLGGKHLMVARNGSVSYFDIGAGDIHRMINVRGACQNTLIQADGLLNAPWPRRHGCRCSYSFLTSAAMLHMPEVEGWRSTDPFPMTPPDPVPERAQRIPRWMRPPGGE